MTPDHALLFDHFEVERVLGTGAMGVVYLARDVRIGRQVALKTQQKNRQKFDNDEAAEIYLRRFRREAQLCGSLLHPNLVTLYEVGYEASRFTYLAMEYVDGESLLSLLRRKGALPEDDVCHVIDDVLQGLAYAHERGIVHRDIKPANILVSVSGQAKLTDFGIARGESNDITDLTERGQILGTPHYMAPEQIAGLGVDGRSDLFSLGVVMFEALAGKKPFEGVGLTDVLYNVVNAPAPDLSTLAPAVSADIRAFVEKLLAKNPDERFASATDASRELRHIMTSHQLEVITPMPPLSFAVSREVSADDTPTTPIMTSVDLTPPPTSLRRSIPMPLAAGAITLALAISGAALYGIARQIDDRPTAQLTAEQREDHSARRRLLDDARLLHNVGAYEESNAKLNEYLERFPGSPAANELLARNNDAIEAARVSVVRPATPVATASVVSSKPSRKPAKAVVKPTFWTRVRKFFSRSES